MMPALRWVRRTLRERFGIWVLFEARNRAFSVLSRRQLRRWEDEQVARLRASVSLPHARVAVVMPTYRRPELLLRALESALRQTEPSVAVIIVDDGAGLPALPPDPRVAAVSLAKNTSILGMVRNVGIRLTQSDYIAFLDDDNEWEPDHLTTALDALSGGCDMVYTQVRRCWPDGTELDLLSRPFDRHAMADEAYVDVNAVVVRRTPDVRFSRIPRGKHTLPKEDWEFVYRLSKNRRVCHVEQPTVRYLVNPGSYYTTWNG
jgi:cellulose synthase/poly-beta-1,6-N-acetylglucosamine synthase-like glycosyltransferase